MLWNPDIKLPDVERAELLKAKETKKVSNTFAAVAKRNKTEKIDQPSAKDDSKVIWKSVIPEYSVPGRQQCQHGCKEKQHGMCKASGPNAFIVNPTICIY